MDSAQKMTSTEIKPVDVLVADDDAPTRILLKAAISQWGYRAVEAKDGEEAWTLIKQENAPRILILDWLMPKIDGITLCKMIRKELTEQPYIILLTQMTGSNNVIKGLEAGVDEFLPKPFNMVELRSRLIIGSRFININQENNTYKKVLGHINKKLTELDEIITDREIKKAIIEMQTLLKVDGK